MTAKKKKTLAAIGTVALALVIALGGTFAWQSISQQALNEAAATLNPGGRLHDDFDGRNKDVYVENFTDVADGTPIFARVRLDEYMELGLEAGKDRNLAEDAELTATGLTVVGEGAKINDKTTWTTRTPGSGLADEAGNVYWAWDMDGGKTVYMPTFNKNKDSLKSDVNGTYDGTAPNDKDTHYDDYKTYTVGDSFSDQAVYDDDSNDIEDNGTRTNNETHSAKPTINGTVITMAEWMTRWGTYQATENPTDEDKAQVMGDFWVWDDDGWAYWANAIQPDTATGLLLDGIELTNPPSDSYYYGINVVGQFVTADDIGFLNGTGFYDTSNGKDTIPSENAETLLELLTGQNIDIARVEISIKDTTVYKGESTTVSATVYKGNEEVKDASLEWSVEGAQSENTKISSYSSSQRLSVGLDEPSDEITVVCAYTGADGKTVYSRQPVTLLVRQATLSVSATSSDPVKPGSTLELTATVYRGSKSNSISADSVSWSVSGNTDEATQLSPAIGAATTLTVGENESRGPFTVTASFYDAELKETLTKTYSVTADVPVPLSAKLSAEIREKNIENMNDLDLDYSAYKTVDIGGSDAYVLAVDEGNNRALLGIRYNSRIQWVDDPKSLYNISYSVPWATSHMRLTWASNKLKNNPVLDASAILTDIYTRNPGNLCTTDIILSDSNRKNVNNYATVTEDEKWIITPDKLFLFTEADIRGTDYWGSKQEYISGGAYSYPTADEKDYTYGEKAIIPREILKRAETDTSVRAVILRSPPQEPTYKTTCMLFYQQRRRDVNDVFSDDMLALQYKTTASETAFVGVWVMLSPAE